MKLEQICDWTGGRLVRGDPSMDVTEICTDTRRLRPQSCFVALRGPRFDGHQFVADAARLGAGAAVVSDPTCAMNSPSALALLQVQDTLTALHKLAANYRRLLSPTTRLIAVSGACGKTTTKEMIAAVLGERFHVFKTPANQNNHIGVPLSLLSMETSHEFGVLELGSNHPGEMRVLAEMVRPEMAVVTNIGLAHVEFLGDEAGVAREEGTPLEYLPRNGDGLAVLNADDAWCGELRARTRATVVTVGIERFADIRACDIVINGDVKFRLHIAKKREDVVVRLRTVGRHQIYNALQAAAVGYFCGLDLDEIREGLENVEFPKQRMEVVERNGVRFLNDCYNANLPSMEAAVRALGEYPWSGRKIAVLGDMLELGAWTEWAHRRVGELVAGSAVTLLVTVGSLAREIAAAAVKAGMEAHRVFEAPDTATATELVGSLVREGDLVLVKGSRKLELERLTECVKQ
ncbi:MAG: UDP-N-acetylmuramoyl-tripeptide--D-alanyl-D-alanine ligase [Verrucomicrobiae bacterium]|nr:UDP-N-acetylmuramoyl-tripeptide--D-alanyl-D-alanine ligase [Verrucomicrobiae bacterium]